MARNTIQGVAIRTDYDTGELEVNCRDHGNVGRYMRTPAAEQARCHHLSAYHGPRVDVRIDSAYGIGSGYREVEASLTVILEGASGGDYRVEFRAASVIHGIEGDETIGGDYVRTRRTWTLVQVDHRGRQLRGTPDVYCRSLRECRDRIANAMAGGQFEVRVNL